MLDDPEPGFEPDLEYIEAARWRSRFDGLFPAGFDPVTDRFTDPELARAARWDDLADPLLEVFRAVLFLRGWRLARRIAWPALALLLLLRCLLPGLIREGGQDATGPLGADRRPVADPTPTVALLRARSMLFACAPPARVPRPAGTAG